MLEVEVKIEGSKENIAKLTKDAKFIKEVTNDDIYFDTKDFKLTTKTIWLRTRNGRWELKWPVQDAVGYSDLMSAQYFEIEDHDEILERLELPKEHPIEKTLKNSGLIECAHAITTRQKYKDGEFNIDIDSMDYGYNLIEVELVTEDDVDAKKLEDKIWNYIESKGIDTDRKMIRGKVITFLKRHKPNHFQILINAGVIKL